MINQEEANKARSLLVQIPNYLPDIEKILPARAAAVRAKVTQFDNAKYGSPYEKFYSEYGRDLHLKSLQELVALAPKAPQDVRQNVYYQAVNKAIEQGDEETARKIVKENIPDKWQANDLLSNIERRTTDRAVGEGKYAEARKFSPACVPTNSARRRLPNGRHPPPARAMRNWRARCWARPDR